MHDETLERLATFAHGFGAAINGLGLAYNVLVARTLIDRDVAIHAACFAYHLHCALKHKKRTTYMSQRMSLAVEPFGRMI